MIQSTELIKESLDSIGKLLHISVDGVGWTQQGGAIKLLGALGAYFASPDVQTTVEKNLSEIIQSNNEARMLPAAHIGLNGNHTIALLPCDFIPMGYPELAPTGLLLALPPGVILEGGQWGAVCSISKLVTAALYGMYTLEESSRRQVRLEAVAEVGRDATILLDPSDLLNRVAHLISYQFGFYHTGIFLVDELGEYAVLRATNSDYGRQLIAHNHRLKIGEQGMVGHVTGTGQARIASDVGVETTYYVNPFLPHTRSEMTLPMHYGGQVVGALDVQSTEANAFTEEDCTTLQIMADQLANALVNARLHEEVWQRLENTRLLREIMVKASALNRQEVLQKALELLRAALPYPYQAFFERKGDTLIATPGSQWPKPSFSILDTPLREVWDGWAIWQSSAPNKLKWVGHGIRALSALPIRNGDTTLALFTIATADPDHLRPRDQHFLETLAAQLSILLQNAMHYESTARGQALLQHLAETEEAMAAKQEVPAILDILSQALLSKIQGTVEIALYKQDAILTWVKQEATPDLEEQGFIADLVDEVQLSKTDTHLATYHLIKPGEIKAQKSLHPTVKCAIQKFPQRYIMLQPLQTSERNIGFILITLNPPLDNNLNERIAWIQALANQTALALNNAQLIARLKVQTQELGIACEEAQHLNEIRAQMLQNVSHELRTPLGIILGYAGILQEEALGPLNAQQREIVQMINSRAQYLNRMIQNLVSLQGRIQLKNITPIALQDLIQRVVREFDEFAQEQNVQFYIEAELAIPPIPGNLEQLHLALTHLVENAIKFSPGGGSVLIRMWAEEHWVLVTFADQGVGIATEHLERIFDRFYQADGSTTRRFGGMGVGLALVWDIIEAHHGQIQVQSAEGEGSTFLIALPRVLELDEVCTINTETSTL